MSDLSEEEVEQVSTAIEENSDNDIKHQPVVEDLQNPTEENFQMEKISEITGFAVNDLQRMNQIKVKVEVQLGQTKMPIEEILKLQNGSIVELNYLAGEPVDIVTNNKVIAKAEVVVIEDSFGIKISKIVGTADKLKIAGKPIVK